jgi:hypothetical protein
MVFVRSSVASTFIDSDFPGWRGELPQRTDDTHLQQQQPTDAKLQQQAMLSSTYSTSTASYLQQDKVNALAFSKTANSARVAPCFSASTMCTIL